MDANDLEIYRQCNAPARTIRQRLNRTLGRQVAQGFNEDINVSRTRLLPMQNEMRISGVIPV